ncbi:hypothetical protein ACJRO7_024418 [Eucalyptus globulus]|uniref:non-specific serine/threonine protein kinase n=1 Tax=Eucalyptus globulus TaxID=34317 RepID=A0ABD3KA22_EUCGL
MNTHLPLLCAMFLVMMINLIRSQSNEDLYSNCSNLFNCGNIRGIGFPFGGGNRSSRCGHPELQLVCEDNAASITISDVKYKVLGVYPDIKVLRIAREDFSSGICSPLFLNTTLDPPLFSMANGYSNYTFFYGCPNWPTPSAPGQFSCNKSGITDKKNYGFPGAMGPGNCLESVVFPVSQSLLAQSASLENIARQGFEVRFGVDSAACARCANSKGVCGYDNSKNTTACYCPDGSLVSATCSPPAAGGPQGQPPPKGYLALAKDDLYRSSGALSLGTVNSLEYTMSHICPTVSPTDLLSSPPAKDQP